MMRRVVRCCGRRWLASRSSAVVVLYVFVIVVCANWFMASFTATLPVAPADAGKIPPKKVVIVEGQVIKEPESKPRAAVTKKASSAMPMGRREVQSVKEDVSLASAPAPPDRIDQPPRVIPRREVNVAPPAMQPRPLPPGNIVVPPLANQRMMRRNYGPHEVRRRRYNINKHRNRQSQKRIEKDTPVHNEIQNEGPGNADKNGRIRRATAVPPLPAVPPAAAVSPAAVAVLPAGVAPPASAVSPVHPPGPFISPARIVHFDLKGAPPKVDFLIEMFKLIKRAGATGVLMEWEDTFPFTGRFENATSLTAYLPSDVERILEAARAEELDVIPLVQTMAHLEWILKLAEFKHLRDTPAYSTVMCVAKDEAWDLLRDMVDQVMAMHLKHDMPYIHIGLDEVFQVGGCQEARSKMQSLGGNKERYMLWHIARMARHIKHTANNTNVLIWHDMIATIPTATAAQEGVHNLVEPVVWNYAEDIERYMSPAVWENLKPYGAVWGASAYKGADGPMRYHANPNHYVRNHQSWLRQISLHHRKFRAFRGLILTGWSRYDHFAVLAELHPVAVPALVMSLVLISAGISNPNFAAKTKEVVGCAMTPPNGPQGRCSDGLFPGYSVYTQVQQLRSLRSELPRDIYSDSDPGFEFNGWLGRMNLAQTFSSAWYLQKLLPKVNSYFNRFTQLFRGLERDLKKIYQEDTVAEWLYEYLGKDLEQLGAIKQTANRIRVKDSFLRRPLPGVQPVLKTLQDVANNS